MNDRTGRLIGRMRHLHGQYSQKEITLGSLVGGLELNLNTIDERLAEDFNRGWYSHWGTFEVALAMSVEGLRTEDESRAQCLEAVEALDHLLQASETRQSQQRRFPLSSMVVSPRDMMRGAN